MDTSKQHQNWDEHIVTCGCGCGEKLEAPQFLLQKGRGLQSILSYWKRHPYKKNHGIWERRTDNYIAAAGNISVEVLGLIYGTLLGDAAITYPNKHSRFPRIAWTHGYKQKEWLEYKIGRLSELRPNFRIAKNDGYGELSVCSSTMCHPQLNPVFNVVKPTGISKSVSMEWLEQITPEGLAWWYMDDGALMLTPEGSPTIHLSTEGYSLAENELIQSWLQSIGYNAKVQFYKRGVKTYNYICMGANASRKWLSELQQYSIPSMEYKFGEGRICNSRW